MIVKYYYIDKDRIGFVRDGESFWIGYPNDPLHKDGYQYSSNVTSDYSLRDYYLLPALLYKRSLYSGFAEFYCLGNKIKWRHIETDNN